MQQLPYREEAANQTRHYVTLDLLRGVAAIGVAAFHLGIAFGPLHVGSAYLAVDFFFVLSGFVIAHAYDRRLAVTMSTPAFLQKRLIRLFPLYLAGTIISAIAVCFVVFVSHDARHWTPGSLAVAVLLGMLMLPSPFTAALYPLNDPAWSLFFEGVINGAYGAGIFREHRVICVVPAVAALGLLAEGIMCGSLDHGATWGDQGGLTLIWAAFRVAYSFPVGVLLYRYHNKIWLPRVPPSVLLLLLAAMLCVAPGGTARSVFDLAFVLAVSPALVLAGCRSRPAAGWHSVACGVLGSISYPLYVLHRPVMSIIEGASRRITHVDALLWAQRPWFGLAVLAALIAVAAAADQVDQQIRRGWLMGVPPSRSRQSAP